MCYASENKTKYSRTLLLTGCSTWSLDKDLFWIREINKSATSISKANSDEFMFQLKSFSIFYCHFNRQLYNTIDSKEK